MNPSANDKIVSAQLAALVARLGDKKPLTAAQLEFVQSQLAAKAAHAEGIADSVAASASQLAKLLGVSRQVISYHRTRAGAPKSLCVSEWRDYLIECGKAVSYVVADGQSPQARRRILKDGHIDSFSYENGLLAGFFRISNALPIALSGAMKNAGMELPAPKFDRAVFEIWLLLAGAAQNCADQWECSGPLDCIDRKELPEIIELTLNRITGKPVGETSAD